MIVSGIFSNALPWRLVLLPALAFDGLGGRGELTMLFAPFGSLGLRIKLSLSLSLDSEFDFFKPLNTLKNSIALKTCEYEPPALSAKLGD